MANPGSSASQDTTADLDGYPFRSQRPLATLLFLLPMVLLYEAALPIYGADQLHHVYHDIYARRLLQQLFAHFGVTGYYLPGLIVMVVLLSWHFVSRDRWYFEPSVYGWMWIESLLLALPLFVFMLVVFRPQCPEAAMQGNLEAIRWQAQLLFSVGAGIYEELLFRLLGVTLIHAVLVDMLAMPSVIGTVVAVLASAIAFALYHFGPGKPFQWVSCLFFAAAGVYFAVIYLLRGFGIVAGTHALYDVMVTAMVSHNFG